MFAHWRSDFIASLMSAYRAPRVDDFIPPQAYAAHARLRRPMPSGWRWSMQPRNLHDMLDFHTPGSRRRRNPKSRHLFTNCWRRQHGSQPARSVHDNLA